jgi:lipopolysaccharide transport system permease protein
VRRPRILGKTCLRMKGTDRCDEISCSRSQFDEDNVLNSPERLLEPAEEKNQDFSNTSEQRPLHVVQDPAPSPATARSPVLVIEHSRWAALELADLWAHRELFYFLAWRDVKVRYKQTALGASWAILQPLLSMIVFTVLFGRLARVPSEGQPYAIFSYAGLLPWNFFTAAVTNSSNSLVSSNNLISKVYFPRILVPTAAVGAALVDIAIASMMLLAIMPIYGVGFHSSLIMLIPLIALTALTAAALGIWTAALNVKYRDIRYALPFVIQLLMFLTPVIYPISFLPTRWRWVLRLNPLSGIIEGFRDAVFGRSFNWEGLAISILVTLALLVAAALTFSRMEEEFADII